MMLPRGLVVSCQARADNPLHGPQFMGAMALAARDGGAVAIRANGPADIAAVKASGLPVIGIHNGIILNDDELLAPFSCARSEPRMTVDSEAIFALAAHSHNDPLALEDLTGSLAAAWLDARVPGTIFAARGAGRPLWIGAGRHELFFASTRRALEVVERYARVKLRKSEVAEGTFLELREARVARAATFRHDRDYRDPVDLPTVRAPQEGVSCLERLAVLTAAAA